ncbi:MAG TPA: YciI family protein [Woeseiaceae bacterium]|nr:YciI family protein [Woeseiaceae bacterium]
MKYLCLAWEDEATLDALTREEWDELRRATLDYVDSLRASGHLLATEALKSAREGVSLRIRNGMLATTDGPFTETKEQLGGFFLLEAADLNEAIQIASRWPSAQIGTIEVRPVETELREDGRYAPLPP